MFRYRSSSHHQLHHRRHHCYSQLLSSHHTSSLVLGVTAKKKKKKVWIARVWCVVTLSLLQAWRLLVQELKKEGRKASRRSHRCIW
jgi:hypothetical protein